MLTLVVKMALSSPNSELIFRTIFYYFSKAAIYLSIYFCRSFLSLLQSFSLEVFSKFLSIFANNYFAILFISLVWAFKSSSSVNNFIFKSNDLTLFFASTIV